MARSPVSPDRNASGREDRWYVARTHQHGERLALENLQAQAFGVFLPMTTPDRVTKTGAKPQPIPLFPGYIFVQFDMAFDANWPAINNTRGVKRLLPTTREQPIPIPTSFVERIRKMMDAGDFEPDEVEDILASFVPQQMVSIVAGGFEGHAGRFVGRKGLDLELLVACFGRETHVTVPLNHVEHPASPIGDEDAVAVEAA
jgi:transcriptional antiterminator RfaH